VVIDAPYELKIPSDSPAILVSGGVLGPPLIDIDTRTASGPPIGKDGTLKSMQPADDQGLHAIEAIAQALTKASRKPENEQTSSDVPGKSKAK
jgi:hypothetical protein